MRYLFILLLLGGCTTTQIGTTCERAKEYIAAAEQTIAHIKATCNLYTQEPE